MTRAIANGAAICQWLVVEALEACHLRLSGVAAHLVVADLVPLQADHTS